MGGGVSAHRAFLKASLLKISVIVAGVDSGYKAPPEQVTDNNLILPRRVVVLDLSGIVQIVRALC